MIYNYLSAIWQHIKCGLTKKKSHLIWKQKTTDNFQKFVQIFQNILSNNKLIEIKYKFFHYFLIVIFRDCFNSFFTQ